MIQSRTIVSSLPLALSTCTLPRLGQKSQGKVRDIYLHNDVRVLVTTDRQSAFDVVLGTVPFKGAVLNLLSQFWFEKTRHIIQNHMVSVPDPNVMIVRNCQPIPVEMIVRGYMSGVTKTSIWYSYQRGERVVYGIELSDGMKKNQKLPTPIITPTTHPLIGSAKHDERLTKEQIIKEKIVPKKLYEQMEEVSLRLFRYGSSLCRKQGLILVDTKYEFGLYNGKLMVMDEMHTPDSSRFWLAESYPSRFMRNQEPENFDKEFLRLWYAQKGYRGDGPPPPMTKDLTVALAKRYLSVYERITGKKFPPYRYPVEKRITRNLNHEL